MLYQRPFSPWIIEVIDNKVNHSALYDVVFRTTIRERRECEQFTLLVKNDDEALIQLRMFKDGEVTSETWVPAVVRLSGRKKHIVVTFLEPLSRTRKLATLHRANARQSERTSRK